VNDGRVPANARRPPSATTLLTTNVDVRGEIATDGSRFLAARLIAAGVSIEAIHRYASDRDLADRGLSHTHSRPLAPRIVLSARLAVQGLCADHAQECVTLVGRRGRAAVCDHVRAARLRVCLFSCTG